MFALILEWGIATASWYAEFALRRRASMSAIGSVIVMAYRPSSPWFPQHLAKDLRRRYQLLLVTPGSSPACAISRRHTRHKPNLRYTECGRPHLVQRVYARTLNFGVFCCF